MPGKRHTAEQIIRKLREAKVELAKGRTPVEVVRQSGIPSQTRTGASSPRPLYLTECLLIGPKENAA